MFIWNSPLLSILWSHSKCFSSSWFLESCTDVLDFALEPFFENTPAFFCPIAQWESQYAAASARRPFALGDFLGVISFPSFSRPWSRFESQDWLSAHSSLTYLLWIKPLTSQWSLLCWYWMISAKLNWWALDFYSLSTAYELPASEDLIKTEVDAFMVDFLYNCGIPPLN